MISESISNIFWYFPIILKALNVSVLQNKIILLLKVKASLRLLSEKNFTINYFNWEAFVKSYIKLKENILFCKIHIPVHNWGNCIYTVFFNTMWTEHFLLREKM